MLLNNSNLIAKSGNIYDIVCILHARDYIEYSELCILLCDTIFY